MAIFTVNATAATITPNGNSSVSVDLETGIDSFLDDVSISDIINHFGISNVLEEIDISDIIDHYITDDILENIDPNTAMKFYGIQPED